MTKDISSWEEFAPIAKAIEKLENLGDIKCNIPECGDIFCASSLLWNALAETQKLFLSQREQMLEGMGNIDKKSHACAFNDGEQNCKCFNSGVSACMEIVRNGGGV